MEQDDKQTLNMEGKNMEENKITELEGRVKKLEGLISNLNPQQQEKASNEPNDIDQTKNYITYKGFYKNKSGGFTNFGGDYNLSEILDLQTDFIATFLSSISNPDRINIMKIIMQKEATAKEICEKLNFKSTGKVYHHLNFLEKASLSRKRGDVYCFGGSRMSPILVILTGIYNYSQKLRKENIVFQGD